MYLQLTSNCNMACEHCCMSTSKYIKGVNMDLGIAKAVIDMAAEWGTYLSLGGGEPTLHPEFKEILRYGLAAYQHAGDGALWMATNGKKRKMANWVLKKAYREQDIDPDNPLFTVELSQDDFHEDIDLRTVEAFKQYGSSYGSPYSGGSRNSAIRTTSWEQVSDSGFARENGLGQTDKCACSAIQLKANREVRLCGCDDAPVMMMIDTPQDVATFEKRYVATMDHEDWRQSECWGQLEENSKEELIALWN